MPFIRTFELCIIALYLLATILYFTGVIRQRNRLKQLAQTLAVAGFGLHTLDLGLVFFRPGAPAIVQGQFYISLLAWTFLAIYFLLWRKLRLEFLALTAAPLALILFTSSMAVTTERLAVPAKLSSLWFGLHVGTFFLSIALLAMAFGAGIVYLYVDKKIKTKAKLSSLNKDMPALTSVDQANRWAVMLGFPLYTLGLFSGFAWARFTWGRIFSWDPKEIVSLLIWFLFAYLFHQRLAMNWTGRKPAKLAIWIFVLTILSLWGVNFLLPTHHSLQP
ncbi:cytochrome C assembly family protein [Desulfohalobium retbaense]|uniref:Cytochrome c assembly protein n=1 Tax=Desulfohalobium retbaense (strain ATCC 49708 / DSM 5692 / JCM 16813 / HR100) TaxID=485915 RepID=C8X2V4_DESRD|nr:cytochrome c biogenesis protein CcsA [Desulfohalobium retbaense]ACV68751.1 cytochrome c assembly protein [Desulfohalobium retbaense DSM 5692]